MILNDFALGGNDPISIILGVYSMDIILGFILKGFDELFDAVNTIAMFYFERSYSGVVFLE